MLTVALIALPAVAGVLLLLVRGENAKKIALASTLAELGLGLYVVEAFKADATSQFNFAANWIASANIQFSVGIDGLSVLLVLLTTLLLPLIVLATFGRSIANVHRFYALMLFMQAALVGVFVAKDAFLFYFFFEAALIPVYFLAAIWGGEDRIRVTFKFFVYTIFGSLFMLLALVWLYFQTPEHTSAIAAFYQLNLSDAQQSLLFGAFFIAFAIKMPVFPFHTWQPDTYTTAPFGATMLLSGIMLKMGTYGMLRFLMPIAPAGVEAWGGVAMILSVIGIVYGSIIAIQQRDMKRLIAYSSFAHVGLMSAGILSQTLDGIQGSLIQMLSHGVNVVGLFFVVEVIESRTKSRQLDNLGGITQHAPYLSVFFIVLMLGSVALPLTNGFVGEFLLLKSVYEYNLWIGVLAGTTIILGAVYMLRMVQKSMFGETSSLTATFDDLSLTEKLVFVPLVIMVFWIGLHPNTFMSLTEPAATELLKYISK